MRAGGTLGPIAELCELHRCELEVGSSISPEIIEEMGAWTATTKTELSDLGFTQDGIRPPALVFPVKTWGSGCQPVYSRIKPDAPRADVNGKARKYEQPMRQPCRVYCLPTARRLIEGLQGVEDKPAPQLPYIFITEGEKKTASLVSHGLAALGLPGVWNFKHVDALRGDWDLIGLKCLAVCIVFDSDAATNPQVRKAEDRLAAMLRALGARVHVCRLPLGPDGEKTGADDYFVQGGTVEELTDLIEEHVPPKPEAEPNVADRLIRLGSESARFWHDDLGEAYATVPLSPSGYDNLPVRNQGFRAWLAGAWFRREGRAAPREAMDRAVETLAAEAKYGDGAARKTAIRIGHSDGAVYVDLCDEARRIVRVDAEGWDFVPDDACPVRFLRPKHAGALPEPVRGEDLSALRDLLCVDADGRLLVEAYLLGAFMPPPGGCPLFVATGEQGSGKSFGCRVVRRLIDPASPDLRNPPDGDRDLIAALGSGYVLAFDNLARVSPKLSHGLCSLATGGGIAARKLYTDSEEHVVTGRRPVLLNGINDVASAPDLAERCLLVEFTRPQDGDRKTEAGLEAVLLRHAGGLLGALLDRVSRAQRDRGRVDPGALPRMADFALWVYAGTPEAERDVVWSLLAENRRAKNLATIEEDALASAVRALAEAGGFTGSAREMLSALNAQEGIGGPKTRPEGWPASADALGKRLRRLGPVLRAVGVEVGQSRNAKARTWTVTLKEGIEVSQASHVSSTDGFEPTSGGLVDDTSRDTCAAVSLLVSTLETPVLNLAGVTDDTCDASDASSPISSGASARRVVKL